MNSDATVRIIDDAVIVRVSRASPIGDLLDADPPPESAVVLQVIGEQVGDDVFYVLNQDRWEPADTDLLADELGTTVADLTEDH